MAESKTVGDTHVTLTVVVSVGAVESVARVLAKHEGVRFVVRHPGIAGVGLAEGAEPSTPVLLPRVG